MFGRRAKRNLETTQAAEPDRSDDGPTDLMTVEFDLSTMADTAGADTSSPIRSPGAGHDSGLAQIEAEFTISEADLALLDLSAIAFDQQAQWVPAVDATMARHRAELDDFMDRLNAAWTQRTDTPIDLQPFFMVPERCWEGEHQEVLVEVLGLTPTQPWNALPLAADAATAAATGVAMHPGMQAFDHRAVATGLIAEAVETMHKTFEQATFAADTVDTAALDAARAQAAADITAIARRMAEPIIGAAAVDTARATFFGTAAADDRPTSAN